MLWPYPSEDTDPWWEQFKAFIEAADASAYASREDRNLVVTSGGTFSFDAGTDELIWSSAIQVYSPVEGFLVSVVSPSGAPHTLIVPDGSAVYFNTVRAPGTNVQVLALVANQIPNTDTAVLLAVRRGDKIYFRDGATLGDGESADVFEEGGGGGGGSAMAPPRQLLTLATNESTDQSSYESIGAFVITPSDYQYLGHTVTLLFRVVANITTSGLNGTVVLYNITTSTIDATIPITSTTAANHTQGFTAPVASTLYEVRYKVTGGSTSADRIALAWAGVQIDRVLV